MDGSVPADEVVDPDVCTIFCVPQHFYIEALYMPLDFFGQVNYL